MRSPRDLTQIRFVTANYPQLQGLRLVPFGIALLLATPLYAGWHFTQSGILLALWLVPVAVGCVLWWLVGQSYTRTFGQVQPLSRPTAPWHERAIVWGLLLAGLFLGQQVSSARLWLALMTLALLASVLFSLRRSASLSLRRHWLIISTVLATINLALLLPLPLLQPDAWPTRTLFAIWVASIGLGMLLGGLLDHRLLLRTLGAPTQDHDVQTV
jgi:hypothetical protein